MKAKITSRDIKNEQTRQLILDAANKLLHERRYEDVTIKDICDSCGASVGAFYHHFGSKEHLVELFYIEFDQYISQFIDEFSSLPPLDALYALVGREMDYLSTNVTYPSQICVMQLVSGGDAFKRETRRYYQCLSLVIGRILADCEVTAISEPQLRSMLLRFTRGVLYDWCLHGGAYDLKAQAISDVRMLMEGLIATGEMRLSSRG